jgi:hypothetical protein
MIPVMNLALALGVALVMPLCLGGRRWPWLVAAASVAAALVAPDGPLAGALVGPWLALSLACVVRRLLEREWLAVVNAGFAVVAASALLASRVQFTAFGIVEPIVKLTALHFSYAGVGTLWLARQVLAAAWGSTLRRVTVGLVVIAPVLVALGFVTRLAVFQVGGAVVMTLGTWSVALLALVGLTGLPRSARVLTIISSLCPWVSMVLGVAWAAANYWPWVPALTVVDMVPTHGALNAFGFVGCGVMARALASRSQRG